jgi:hypothetical protein
MTSPMTPTVMRSRCPLPHSRGGASLIRLTPWGIRRRVASCGSSCGAAHPRSDQRGGGSAEAGDATNPGHRVAGAVGSHGRTGVAQVREPATHWVVQAPRRLQPDRQSERGGPGSRCGRGQRRQPCAGSCVGRDRAKDRVDGVHAGQRPAPKAGGHQGVWRASSPDRRDDRRRAGRGA